MRSLMEGQHEYAQELAVKIAQRPSPKISLKLKTLLHGFGYYRRNESIVEYIQKQLTDCNLKSDFSLKYPSSLEDKVTIVPLNAKPGNLSVQNSAISLVETSVPTIDTPVNSTPKTPTINSVDSLDSITRAVSATVQIISENGSGSGFIIDPLGLVITARHVVENEEKQSHRFVKVRLHPDKPEEKILKGVTFRSHKKLDFALVWILDEGCYPDIIIGNPKTLRHTQRVYAIGSPGNLPNTVSEGIISNPDAKFNNIEVIQTDAAIDHGNSGGPLINVNGEALAINVWGLGTYNAAKFCIPLDYIKEDIEIVRTKGKFTSLNAFYCLACGFLDFEEPTWFCRNCGIQHELKKDEIKEKK